MSYAFRTTSLKWELHLMAYTCSLTLSREGGGIRIGFVVGLQDYGYDGIGKADDRETRC